MIYRKRHPYERKNPELPEEDVVKKFENHNQAITFFSLFFVLSIILSFFLLVTTFPKTDISLFVFLFLVIITGFALHKPMFRLLSKLFKDPSTGMTIMCFFIVSPFILSILLWLNTLVTFDTPEEKIEIIRYEAERRTKRHRSTYTVYVLQLEGNKFYFQPEFRTLSHPPNGHYITYRFKRGIVGLRVLDQIYVSE